MQISHSLLPVSEVFLGAALQEASQQSVACAPGGAVEVGLAPFSPGESERREAGQNQTASSGR